MRNIHGSSRDLFAAMPMISKLPGSLLVWLGLFLLNGNLDVRAVVPWTLGVNTNNILVVTNTTYGAVGDGISTNTSAIQAAINAAAARVRAGVSR